MDGLVWILEEDDIYGAKYLRGVFASEGIMVGWVMQNVQGPVSLLRAHQEVVDRPDRRGAERRLRSVDGMISLVESL